MAIAHSIRSINVTQEFRFRIFPPFSTTYLRKPGKMLAIFYWNAKADIASLNTIEYHVILEIYSVAKRKD